MLLVAALICATGLVSGDAVPSHLSRINVSSIVVKMTAAIQLSVNSTTLEFVG